MVQGLEEHEKRKGWMKGSEGGGLMWHSNELGNPP